ncbi:MAG: shikimate kinase [Verrucomicrobiota bacterium]|nr:shikimate kinase [Verrucomicrobiota bacterium]
MAERGEAIVLIGFMGTGKSSVGRALAQLTGLRRYDTDQIVARRFGMPIAQIFAQHGETAFRDAEASALDELPRSAAVIVTGGGSVLRAGHVQKIRSLGVVAQLTADLETLLERLSRRATRPLLKTADPRKTVTELLAVRGPLYREAADFTVNTSELRHDEVAERVLAGIEEVR